MSQQFTAGIKLQIVQNESNMETQDIYVRCLNMRIRTKNHPSTLPANVLNYKPTDTPIDTTRHRFVTTTTDEETMKRKLQMISCTLVVPALERIFNQN